MRKIWRSALLAILILLLAACAAPSGPQPGTWDGSKWDESTWR